VTVIAPLLLTVSCLAQAPASGWEVGPTPTPAPLRAPLAVVERLYHDRGSMRRVSLFSDRTAVVSVCEGDHQVFLRRLVLDEGTYIGYVAAVQRDVDRLPEETEDLGESALPRGLITVNVQGTPRTLAYSPLRVQSLGVAGLVATLDDLDRVVSAVSPSHAALQRWQPRVGDRVELWSGDRARVLEVKDGALVVLEYEDVAILEEVPQDRRGDRIKQVLE
jgi:hypothetical protein